MSTEKSWTHRVANARKRKWKSRIVLLVMLAMVSLCFIPLISVMYTLLSLGTRQISLDFLTNLPLDDKRGIGNSIVGSVLILLVASSASVPVGLLCGMYLSQRPDTHTAKMSRLLLDVMSGIPAIVVGMFIYTIVVLPMGGASLLAGGLSLGMIMLPIFARTSEEAIKSIPGTVTEAGLGLGLTRRKVILRVVVRSATPAILTGFFLAIARVGGEAAPLLFTSLDSNGWPSASPRVVSEQIASLPVTIFELARKPFPEDVAAAWGAALVLVIFILMIRLSTNLFVRWRYGQGGVNL